MNRLLSFLALATMTASSDVAAQRRGPPPPPPRTDLSALNDEFDGAQLAPKWSRFDQRFGWPDKLKKIDIGTTTKGALHLEPYHGAWV